MDVFHFSSKNCRMFISDAGRGRGGYSSSSGGYAGRGAAAPRGRATQVRNLQSWKIQQIDF